MAEDDAVLGDALQIDLRQHDYAVDWVRSGVSVADALDGGAFDLLILDLGLPKLDGFMVLAQLRARKLVLPVLILSGHDKPEEKVRGLDLGADDYLVKPFSLEELRARVRALLRRPRSGGMPVLSYGGLSFDTVARTAMIAGKPVDLSTREVGVLEILLSRFGRLVSKEQILDHLYSFDKEAGYNAIEVYVHRLRKKLDGAGLTLRTVHGRGYVLDRDNRLDSEF
ncbi:MAG: response regulator transcription factor [Burkholderiales bacterium]